MPADRNQLNGPGYDAPSRPHSPGSWLAAAWRLIRGLKPRYWALVVLVYSGRAMMPFAPGALTQGALADAMFAAFEFLVRFWMPYLFIRAMAGEPQPGRPGLHFLIFAVIALLFALVESLSMSGAHIVFADGPTDPQTGLRILFAAKLVAFAVTVRLLPLYVGAATQRLSPLEPHWWRGLKGGALGLFVAGAAVLAFLTMLHRILPNIPVVFDPVVIAVRHLHAAVDAAEFLAVLGLSLAACNLALLRAEEEAR